MERLYVRLLGGFQVTVDGRLVPEEAWRRRRGADLVKLLAISDGHRMQRERAVEALWPKLAPEAGLENLHRAAHLARKAFGDRGAVVLREGRVALAPEAAVETDVERFEATNDPDLYGGELLPDDRYEQWTVEARRELRARYLELLRAAGRLEELVGEEPADEDAQRELIAMLAERGDRHAALRQFEGLRDSLAAVGLRPSPETFDLVRWLSRGPAAVAPVAAIEPIVGREPELRMARGVLELARAGRGANLLVTGEAGIGKTRLCEAILTEATDVGLTTLRGSAREGEGLSPYAPVVEALDRLLADRPDLAAGLTDGARGELVRLSIAVPGVATVAATADRQRIFAAVAQLLAHAARERGAVIVLDDLHLADRATLRLVDYLSHLGRLQPLVVVLAFRDVGPERPLAELRSGLVGQRIATELRLEPLDRVAARAIVARVRGRAPARQTTDAIWELAAGNPFFTEELAEVIGPGGMLELPSRLYEVLYARLAPLDPFLRRVVTRLAVAGGEFTADDVAALAGLADEEALAMIDGALGSGLLIEDGGRYRFRHALVRDSLVRALPPHRLAAVHRELASRLASGPNPSAGRVARHLLAGERPKDAVPWLTRAAEDASQVAAYADALELLETALEHAEGAERDGLLPLRADLLLATGDRGAPAAYAEAVATRGDSVELRVKQARALLVAGDAGSATAALEGLAAAGGPDAARLAVTRGLTAWFRADLEQARADAAEARSLAVRLGLWQETVEATALAAAVAHTAGDWTGRVELELGETLTRPDLAETVFDALHCTAEYVLASGAPSEPLIAAARGLRATAERAGATRAQAFAATVVGEAELLAGELAEADAQLRDAVRLNREAGSGCGLALALLRHAEVVAAQRGPREARELLDEALALAHWSPLANHLLYLVYAVMLRVVSEPAAGVDLLDQAQTSLEQHRGCAFCAAGFHVAATMACAAAGDLVRGHGLVELAERGAMLWSGGPTRAAVAEARAALSLAEGATEAAKRDLRRAADGFAAAGQPLNAERARVALVSVG